MGGVGQFTNCTVFDGIWEVFEVQHFNAAGQSDLIFYDSTAGASLGFGLWPTYARDINSQPTTYRYDALGRLIGETLPGDPANANTVSYAYAISCGGAPQPPCVEVDMNQFLGTSPTSGPMVARRFYDGWGHLVETRGISAGVTQGPEDVIHFTDYDQSGRESGRSVGYFVAQWTGPPSPSNPTYATPNRTQPVTSTAYDGLGRVITVTDPFSKQTTTSYSVACNIAGDPACWWDHSGINHLSFIVSQWLRRRRRVEMSPPSRRREYPLPTRARVHETTCASSPLPNRATRLAMRK